MANRVGEPVRIKPMMPPGHIRTPAYLRGKYGVIERHLGAFANPEALAYRQAATPCDLYRVRFSMSELWGDRAERPDDTLVAEIFAHWLEPVEASDAP